MKYLKHLAMLTVIVSIISILSSIGLAFFVKNTESGRAFTVRWQLTHIFKKYGYPVVWERSSDYVQLESYLQGEVKKWGLVTNGWQIPTGDYSKNIGHYFSRGTMVHVLEVEKVIPNGSILTIFLLENPKSWESAEAAKVAPSHDTATVPPIHHHYSLQYTRTYSLGLWDDLTKFPLEHFFPFAEVGGRQTWVN